jgi:polyhydroxybutyrate depolymerase
MMLFVGTADRLMPIEGRARDGSGGAGILSLAETESRWIATNGCSESPNVSMLPDSAPEDGTRVILTSYDDCDALVEVFVVEDGGHTWPGGSERMRLLGRTNRDIDASETIWLFFTEQGLVKYP